MSITVHITFLMGRVKIYPNKEDKNKAAGKDWHGYLTDPLDSSGIVLLSLGIVIALCSTSSTLEFSATS